MLRVIKADQSVEPFDETKVLESIRRAGIPEKIQLQVLSDIKNNVYASGSQDGTVKLWDVRNIKAPSEVVAHGYPVAVINTYSYRMLSACSKNGVVKLWNISGI